MFGHVLGTGSFMPGKFQFTADRDYADYLYLRTDLATLAGKKFQSKRNHVNKFKRTYNYEYTPITPDRIQECLDLEAEWCKANNCDQHEGTGNERRALVYALHNFEELGLTGGILHVDGKIAAFTFGMPINQDTFGVHVEKADTSIDGAYAMINYEFANISPNNMSTSTVKRIWVLKDCARPNFVPACHYSGKIRGMPER